MPRVSVDERRTLLVEAAFRVIARGGVEAATTRAICAEAKMAQASFHYAFTSRDQLLAAVVERGTTDEFVAVTGPLAQLDDALDGVGGSIDDVLRAGLTAYLDALAKDPDREQTLITLSQYARRTPGLESFARRMYERYYEIAAVALDAAARSCAVEWRESSSYLAPLVVSATDGMTLAFLSTGDREVSERIIDATVHLLGSHLKE